MSRHTRIKNKKRFTIAILLAIVICILLVLGLFKLITKPANPAKDPKPTPIENSTGGGIDNGNNPGPTPAPKPLTPEEEKQQRLDKEIADAAAKISGAQTDAKAKGTATFSTQEDFNLILVNKTYTLSKDYWPDDMVTIDRFVQGVGSDDTHKMRKVAADALNEMFDAALNDGIELRLRTGFRSYNYQTSLYNSYVKNHGQAEADTYSARPGNSEHQTGLACDLGGKSQGFVLSTKFGETPEGKWVAEHAHEYGFIIRYIDGTSSKPGQYTGYIYEAWHIRYIGIEHATRVKELGITLEEYLGLI